MPRERGKFKTAHAETKTYFVKILQLANPYHGVMPTTGLNLTDAPSRFVRSRILGNEDETEFDA